MGEPLTTDDEAFWQPLDDLDKKRLRQIARYLMAHWPTPFPVRLRFERIAPEHGCVAETYRSGRRLIIRIHERVCYSWAWGLLLHEWAHAVTWAALVSHEDARERAGHPNHPPDYQAVFGAIESQMIDYGGLDDSEGW